MINIKRTGLLSIAKRINPIIIGTLSITIWEIGLQKLTEKVGFLYMISIAFVSVIALSIVIGWVIKELIEDKKLFEEFERYSSLERLEELLLYSALKCKK